MNPARSPSLLALRAFDVAARLLSFTDAARELHVSQAAVSRHIRTLEGELGRPLFRRLHRKVELTAAGERLASDLSLGFQQIHRAVHSVRGVVTRELRITVERAFAACWLVPRLGGFSLAHPDIDIVLDSSDELRVLGRDADIAIRYLICGSRRPRGRARMLFPLEGFPVAGRRHRPRGKYRSDGEVLSHRLLHDDDGRMWKAWFSAAGIAGYEQAKHLHFDDYSLVLTAAMRGQGVALSAPLFIAPQLRSGHLVKIGLTPVTFGNYWLIEATSRVNAQARTAFVSWLNAEAEELYQASYG